MPSPAISRSTMLALVSGALATAGAAGTATAAPAAAPPAEPGTGELAITGAIPKPLVLGRADLLAMPRATARVTGKQGPERVYGGVPLDAILQRAGAPSGSALEGAAALTLYALVSASDGYRVVFSLAELDAGMSDRLVLLADTQDGAPLGATGPFRVVVPDDKRHPRWVKSVTSIALLSAPAAS